MAWVAQEKVYHISCEVLTVHREDDNLKTRGLEKKKEEEKSVFFFYKIIKFKVFCVSPTLFKIRTRHLCYHTVQYLKSRLCGSNWDELSERLGCQLIWPNPLNPSPSPPKKVCVFVKKTLFVQKSWTNSLCFTFFQVCTKILKYNLINIINTQSIWLWLIS